MHHASNKMKTFQILSQYAKPGARLVICDVLAGSLLAQYFDAHVAQACTTGHEVSFLSRSFAESLCYLTGWQQPVFRDLHLQWHFATREDIGVFLS